MRLFAKYKFVLSLFLGMATLVTGELGISSERSVITAQRFAPDAEHSIPLQIKGKTFYVSQTENQQYYFYENLFFGEFIFICIALIGGLFFKNKFQL